MLKSLCVALASVICKWNIFFKFMAQLCRSNDAHIVPVSCETAEVSFLAEHTHMKAWKSSTASSRDCWKSTVTAATPPSPMWSHAKSLFKTILFPNESECSVWLGVFHYCSRESQVEYWQFIFVSKLPVSCISIIDRDFSLSAGMTWSCKLLIFFLLFFARLT